MTAPPATVFRRSLSARVVPLLTGTVAGALLVADVTASGFAASWWTGVVAGVGVLSAAAAVLAFGDEVRVDADGVRTGNRLLARLGLARFGPGRVRFVAWERVRAVRPFHGLSGLRREAEAGPPRALFLILESGPRLVLDSLQDMQRLQALIEARLQRAAPRPETPSAAGGSARSL